MAIKPKQLSSITTKAIKNKSSVNLKNSVANNANKKSNYRQANLYQEQFVSNAQQIAADISSYRYGKRMTGFNK